MTIRVRITAWYAAVLAAALLAAAAITYAVVRQQLQRSMDASIASTARSITAGLEDEASESHGALPLRSANELLAQFRDNDSGIICINGAAARLVGMGPAGDSWGPAVSPRSPQLAALRRDRRLGLVAVVALRRRGLARGRVRA